MSREEMEGSRVPDLAARLPRGSGRSARDLARALREQILLAYQTGELGAGDRLPSTRDIATRTGATTFRVYQAISILEGEGLLEVQPRAGLFLRSPHRDAGAPDAGAPAWLAGVLGQAYRRRIKLPQLPELIRAWMFEAPLRCACVEASVDAREGLVREVEEQFGIRAIGVEAERVWGARTAEHPSLIARAVREADLVVTSGLLPGDLHLPRGREGQPLLVASFHPEAVDAILRQIQRAGEIAVLCADPGFGEQLRAMRGGSYAQRIRVVPVADEDAVRALDRSQPVLMTTAARERLRDPGGLRLVTPRFPAYSAEFARSLIDTMITLNLQAARSASRTRRPARASGL